MDYFLTEDQKNIQKLARRIAEEKIVPVRAELDESQEIPLGDNEELCRDRAFRGQYSRGIRRDGRRVFRELSLSSRN